MHKLKVAISFLSVLMFSVCGSMVFAQDNASRNAIPYPLKEWRGVQGRSLKDSTPDFIGKPRAPEDAPNVLIVMLDDAGYSSASSYGGIIRTPTFDRIGAEGRR